MAKRSLLSRCSSYLTLFREFAAFYCQSSAAVLQLLKKLTCERPALKNLLIYTVTV